MNKSFLSLLFALTLLISTMSPLRAVAADAPPLDKYGGFVDGVGIISNQTIPSGPALMPGSGSTYYFQYKGYNEYSNTVNDCQFKCSKCGTLNNGTLYQQLYPITVVQRAKESPSMLGMRFLGHTFYQVYFDPAASPLYIEVPYYYGASNAALPPNTYTTTGHGRCYTCNVESSGTSTVTWHGGSVGLSPTIQFKATVPIPNSVGGYYGNRCAEIEFKNCVGSGVTMGTSFLNSSLSGCPVTINGGSYKGAPALQLTSFA